LDSLAGQELGGDTTRVANGDCGDDSGDWRG
jgi:hypothetical protein